LVGLSYDTHYVENSVGKYKITNVAKKPPFTVRSHTFNVNKMKTSIKNSNTSAGPKIQTT